jgi:hypothetical protein
MTSTQAHRPRLPRRDPRTHTHCVPRATHPHHTFPVHRRPRHSARATFTATA